MHKRQIKIAMAKRRRFVADRYLAGWTQTRIAEHLGCDQKTVSNDLKACRKQWAKETNVATDARMQEQLLMLKKARDGFEAARDWNGYVKTLESERKLLGLDAPARKELTGAGGKALPPMILFDFGRGDDE